MSSFNFYQKIHIYPKMWNETLIVIFKHSESSLQYQTFYSNSLFSVAHIFSEMLKQCAKRACYTTLQKHDLLQPLPFENDQFDCLLSVAVTTYLSKWRLQSISKQAF